MKALALSALAAVLLHALLFSLNPSWTRPPQIRKSPSPVTVTLAPSVPPQPIVPLPGSRLPQIAPMHPKAAQKTVAPKPVARKPLKPPRRTVQPRPAAPPPPAAPVAVPLPPSPPTDDAEPGIIATQNAPATPSSPTAPETGRSPDSDAAQAPVQTSAPRYDLNPKPDYPALARRRGYQGTVLLKVLVDARGRAAQVTLARSSGFDILDRGAVKSVSGWRFEPAHRNGRPIDMWVEVPVRYALE